ncbi:MAG: hypothetical protein GW778_00985 [Alphaproteobacteria bacterium]|nr:hypothetical protein [Alphaproteobacteria bacterium]
MLLGATALFAASPFYSANAETKITVETSAETQTDANTQELTEQDLTEDTQDRVQEKREILDREAEQARGEAGTRIQTLDTETEQGTQATATTKIDMR